MIKGIRKEAYNCEAYVSGKSMDDVMEEYGLTHIIKLGSNENSYGPYENALKAMTSEISKLNIYPEKNFIKLKKLLGEKYGLNSSYIGIGHGAGGVLETIARTFLESGDEVLIPQQSYRLYREISKIMGANVKEISLNENYEIDPDDYTAAITEKTKLIWLCNPNNPTGSVANLEKLDRLIRCLPEKTWVVLDEAYAEFAPDKLLPDSVSYIKDHKNVLCVHTFSKYYGLAGARIGYLIADPEVITMYDTVSEPFNANRIGLAGAVTTLENDNENTKKYGQKMIADREFLNSELQKLGCHIFPSYANFVFFSTPYSAAEIGDLLLRCGVIVRPCSGWGYDHHIRVSIGTTKQNQIFLNEFAQVLQKLKCNG